MGTASNNRHKVSKFSALVTFLLSLVGILLVLEILLRLFAPSLLTPVDEDYKSGIFEISENRHLGWQLAKGGDHNSHRMRDDEYDIAKPANTYRVAVIGDSVTYGMGVKRPNIFADVLESMLDDKAGTRVEVLNFGVIAYNPFQVYTDLVNRVLKFSPDMVIYTFAPDDVETTPVVLEINGSYYINFNRLEGWNLFNNDIHWALYRLSSLYRFVYEQIVTLIIEREDIEEMTTNPSVAWSIVSKLASISQQNSADFLLVLSPPLSSNDSATALFRYERDFDIVRQYASSAGLEVIDLGEIYSKQGDAIKIKEDDYEHPNALGHRLIAERLARHIRPSLLKKPTNK